MINPARFPLLSVSSRLINKYPYSTPLGAALSIHGFAFETTAEYIISPLALLIVNGTSLTLGVDM